jgi:hypothetical protein
VTNSSRWCSMPDACPCTGRGELCFRQSVSTLSTVRIRDTPTLHMRCGRPTGRGARARCAARRGSPLRTGRAIDSPFDMWTVDRWTGGMLPYSAGIGRNKEEGGMLPCSTGTRRNKEKPMVLVHDRWFRSTIHNKNYFLLTII